jgi:ATP-dependent helicase/nuclease subunit A
MKNDNTLIETLKPEKSIFVSANAGSGKTFILVARVLGLMLAGEEARKILCISFTEAAANEMKERVKTQCLKWANMENFSEDPILKNASSDVILKAKSLYKDVVLKNKMPKISTFHGFCFEIISSFSPESGMPYRPSILSGSAEKIIKKDILKKLFLQEKTRKILNEIKCLFSNFQIENNILPELLKIDKTDFLNPHEILETPYFEGEIKDILTTLEAGFLQDISFEHLNMFQNLMESGSVKDAKIADKLKVFLQNPTTKLLEEALLTKAEKMPFSKPITKGTLEKAPFLEDIYTSTTSTLLNFIAEKNLILSSKITENLINLISKIGEEYELAKQKVESLDFNDLISKTKKALYSDSRDFILFKLDGGINHILVDEAQDTNFVQWEILFAILEEFFSGDTTLRGKKSLFVVGDEKQSIFGFQGSQPEVLALILKKYQTNLEVLTLQKSYRTTPIILEFVDKIFSKLPQFAGYSNHISAIEGYGKIEILPPVLVTKNAKPEKENSWKMPWEKEEKEILKEQIALQIASKILEILREKRVVGKLGRPVKPCDFMLLSKSRDKAMFAHLRTELKKHNIGISFGDQISLQESLPIQDFLCVLKSLLNPGNTYALACVLRSPLFALNDTQLEEIFLHKTRELPEDFTTLHNFLHLSLERFFNVLIAKFGEKYDENEMKEILQIFTLIENFKGIHGNGNFEGFIQFCESLARADESFKISFSEQENNIKINTVHGSKGLESPIVFILNASEVFSKKANSQYLMQEKNKLLVAKSNMKIPAWGEMQESQKKREYQEYLRLLYVAITRAQEELYIFSKGEFSPASDEFLSWYEILQNNMEGGFLTGGIPNFVSTQKENLLPQKDFIHLPEVQFSERIKTKDGKNKFTKATQNLKLKGKGIDYGSIIHILLEKQTLQENFTKFLHKKFPEISINEIENLAKLSQNVKEKFPEMFSSDALSEVEIMLELQKGEFFTGKIDKLLIYETEVHIIDFKFYETEVMTEEIKEQMKKYANAISKIYPQKKIKTFILWVKSLTFGDTH